jgi:NAD(P)-dependent dehydrogenase (short-subunit alcohol dehydrogenase family)
MELKDSLVPLSSLHDLSTRVALVTGSGSGIGRATALRLAEAGARVCGFDIDKAAAEDTAGMIGDPDRAMVAGGDVRVREQVEAAARLVVDRWSRMDVVVNSAGLFPPAPVMDITSDLWDLVVGVNATGTFLVSQVCARYISDSGGGGAIVNVASKSSFQPTRGFAHYAASKGAVAMATKALALELAPLGIRVNAVAPGSVATEGVQRSGRLLDAVAGTAPTEQTGRLATEVRARSSRCPMGRSASPDEIARVAVFLASEWSSYMTGSIVLVDGGFLVS